MNKRLRSPTSLVLPHQPEFAVQPGLQKRVKANVSFPNSFSNMTQNQYTGLILQTSTRPYLRITFCTQPDLLYQALIDINAWDLHYLVFCLALQIAMQINYIIHCGRFQWTHPLQNNISRTGEGSLAIAIPATDPRCSGVRLNPLPCPTQQAQATLFYILYSIL